MSKLFTLLALLCVGSFATTASATNMPLIAAPVTHTPATLPAAEFGALPLPGVELPLASAKTNRGVADMTRAERRAVRKDFRQNLKQMRKSLKSGNAAASENQLLLILIAIFIAPLAMFLYEGEWTTRVLISLIGWLLFVIPGLIYTLYIILTGK